MSATVLIPIPGRSYPVVIGHRHLSQLPTWLRRVAAGRDPVIVTNRTIRRRCGAALRRVLARGRLHPRWLFVPDTERAKSWPVLGRLLTQLAALDGPGRSLCLVAFGGGVVGDLAGLAAALYRRGIPCIQVPTTLLAQVDSAIGGKTAVDLPAGKNLVGTFEQPQLVFIELSWLAELPPRQLRSGLAEVIKCGVIGDAGLFRLLERRRSAILARQPAVLTTLITRAVRLKGRVVAQDERETRGYRMILNFGHTIGHAIEQATGYGGRYTHGEAIAVGMSAAATLARRLGLCPPTVERRVGRLLEAYELPTIARGVSVPRVLAALAHDKKVRGGRLRWVLPTQIGHVVVTPDVLDSLVRAVIRERVRP